jgi:D-serine deaminase-like pyridoxal phosphate-dependent protein
VDDQAVYVPHLLPFYYLNSHPQILYGVPIPQSAIPRLLHLASKLPDYGMNILIDNLEAFNLFHVALPESAPKIGIYIKIDTGYHRAGITVSSPQFPPLVEAVVSSANFKGFYSHFGHSYAGSSEDDAADGLIAELQALEATTEAVPSTFTGELVLTVGATPTTTAAQNLLSSDSSRAVEFKTLLSRLKARHKVELHAGVYPLLDLQQVATHARPPTSISPSTSSTGFAPLSKDSIGLKMLVEVTSVYTERAKPEALISAGSLALGREPCKSYPGWGIVSAELGNEGGTAYDERGEKTGWIVGRISQEHGILTWEGDRGGMKSLRIGDRVMVWPNHACVAGAGVGWYLVVDSEQDGGEKVVDVWVRWRGW